MPYAEQVNRADRESERRIPMARKKFSAAKCPANENVWMFAGMYAGELPVEPRVLQIGRGAESTVLPRRRTLTVRRTEPCNPEWKAVVSPARDLDGQAVERKWPVVLKEAEGHRNVRKTRKKSP